MKVSRRKLAKVTVELLRSNKNRKAVVSSLAAYLVENKMANQLELLVNDIAKQLADSEGYLLAEVTSAFGATAESRKQITQYLLKETGAKQIELSESTDSDLIGGFTLRIPGYELDASVAHILSDLRDSAQRVVVASGAPSPYKSYGSVHSSASPSAASEHENLKSKES